MQAVYLTTDEEVFWKDQIARHYYFTVRSIELVQLAANITLKVCTGAGEFYLRLYRETGRSRTEIGGEMRALEAFRSVGEVHVVKPVRLKGGGFVFSCRYQHRRRWAALFNLAPGDLLPPNAFGIRRLGEALGILHKQMVHVFPVGRPFDAEMIVSRAVTNASKIGPGFRSASTRMKQEGGALIARLAASAPLPLGFCHGDVWLGKNVHFQGGRVTFFDFDDCVDGPLAIDLATPIAGFWCAGLTDFPAHIYSFLDAYNAVRSLQVSEILAIPTLILVYEFRLLGFLSGYCQLTPYEWEMAVDQFERQVEAWKPDGTASLAISLVSNRLDLKTKF